MRHIISFLFSILLLTANTTSAQNSSRRPDFVAVITVEGLSNDYLQQLSDLFTTDGFKRVVSGGVSIDRVDYGTPLDAAAASAIIHTGAAPMVNGIPAAKVYDTSTHLSRSPLHDPAMMGNFTDETFSPAPLKVTTVADELRMATDGDSRVYAVAPNSYEAIAGAAHAGNGGYWINGMTGNWATTTYYKEMPSAVKDHNYRAPLANRLDTMRWEPLLNLSLYPSLTTQEIKKPFKITFPRKNVQRVRSFLASPLANTEITDVALALINEVSLGKGKATDMISVSYTLPTAVSRSQIIDSYVRLDRDMARLLAAIQKATPNWAVLVIGLPSTDGSKPDDKRWNTPSGLYSVKRALSLMEIQLMAVHGNGNWILGYHDRNFFLNRQLIKDRGLDLLTFRREVADFLGRMAGISNVITIDDIIASRAGDNPAALKRNTSLIHAGDVIIEVSPGWQIIDDGTGRASGVQRHNIPSTPAFFIAPGLKRLDINTPVDARAIAPTLSRLLHVRAPNGASLPALNF